MAIQMLKRGLTRGLHPPIWVWVRPKPDLRQAGYLQRGRKGVLLELEIDSHRILLSDFDAWHCVLNHWYLALTEYEELQFE